MTAEMKKWCVKCGTEPTLSDGGIDWFTLGCAGMKHPIVSLNIKAAASMIHQIRNLGSPPHRPPDADAARMILKAALTQEDGECQYCDGNGCEWCDARHLPVDAFTQENNDE